MRDSVAAILQLARDRKFAVGLERAHALLAACAAEDRPVAEACIAIIDWRARVSAGGAFDQGLREVIAGIARIEQAGCGASLGLVSGTIGYVLGLLGDFETGLEWLDGSIDDALRRNDRMQLVYMYSHKASLFAFAEAYDRAFTLFKQALDLCKGEAEPIRAGLLNNLAYCQILRARRCDRADPLRAKLARQALRYADQALADKESPEYPRWCSTALDNRGTALGMLGRLAEAEAAFDDGLRQPNLKPRVQADLMVDHAEVLIAGGKHEAAAEVLARLAVGEQQNVGDETRDRMLNLQIEIARRFGGSEEIQSLLERRCDYLADRYRERLRNVGRYSDLHAELKLARTAIQESRRRERESVLQDLHDGFGSQLVGARLRSESGELTQVEMTSLLQECIGDLYLVVDALNSEEGSLADALRFMRHRYETRMAGHPIALSWSIALDDAPLTSPPQIIQVLRIVQEALSNALKHAQARAIRIAAAYEDDGGFTVSVEDDGLGLPEPCEERTGLRSMRNRARGLGGTLTLVPLRRGTRVELRFPVRAPA